MAIHVYTGLPGSGKTTNLAQIALAKLKLAVSIEKQTGNIKKIYSNIKFSPQIEKEFKKYIVYFSDIYDMPNWHNSDIFIDEGAIYFDARLWADLPSTIRRFLFTHRHLGVDIYMIAQDFPTLDNSFRRLTSRMYYCEKLWSTREPDPLRKAIKYPINFMAVRTVSKSHWHLEKEHYVYIDTSLRLFTRKEFDVFDTRQDLPEQQLPPILKKQRIIKYVGGTRDGQTEFKYI